MQQAATRPLTPRSEERLLKLLQVGDYAPQEEEDRVINSRLSLKQQSATPTESASETLDAKCSILTEAIEEDEAELSQSGHKEKQPQDSLTDEEEPSLLQNSGEQQAEQNGADLSRQDSMASSNPASDDSKEERSQSASLAPVMPVTTRPVKKGSQNAKRALFESSGEGDRDSIGSLSDYSSTPERHYFGQIKKCIASIEDIMDSSRKLEVRIREKQSPGVQQA
jgi:hypothetical protein